MIMPSSAASAGNPGDARNWRRASRCATNGCVEIAMSGNEIAVRDSKRPDSPVLVYDRTEWLTFIDGVKSGEFDLQPI